MRAIVQDVYGSADVLTLRDIEPPVITDSEVLVRVRAAGVDRGVWHLVAGLPYPVRLAGYGVRAPKQKVPGMDVAGVVEAVGGAVTRFKAGERVFGVGQGTFAEYTRAREDKLAHMPADLGFEAAAAVAISGMTALQGVRDQAKIKPEQQVLVLGASGGVGSFAVQVAKAFGAEVTGVCSAAKVPFVQSLGADHVLDYSREDFADGRRRYDAILDMGGNSTLSRLRRALTPRGTLVIVGGENGGRWLGGIDRQVRAMLLSRFVGQQLVAFLSKETHHDLVALRELIEAGHVRPAVDRTFPLSEGAEALRYLAEGRARGKVVITV